MKGMDTSGPGHKKEVVPMNTYVFAVGKYIEDVKQDEKDVPDLVESIMKGSGIVKEELRLILSNMDQVRPQIKKNRVCTFQMSGKIKDSSKTSPQALLFAIYCR